METYKDIDGCRKGLIAIRDAMELLGGKWKIPIIGALLHLKEARYVELENAVEGITPRMLSKELKELEFNKIIQRKVEDSRPVKITYQITPHGESCSAILKELQKWGEQHRVALIGKAL